MGNEVSNTSSRGSGRQTLRDIVVGYGLVLSILSPFVVLIGGVWLLGWWFLIPVIGAVVTAFAWWCGQDFRKFNAGER